MGATEAFLSQSALGLIALNGGKRFYVAGTNGLDGNPGDLVDYPRKTLADAYALLTDAQNDILMVKGEAGSVDVETGLTWAKNFTHCLGLTAPLGMGQRARLVGNATSDPTVCLTVSGYGNVFENLQIANFADADADSGALLVSGNRNFFKNCFLAGMGHATPAARAAAYSVTVSGDENTFEDCFIGLDTIVRAQANAELIVTGVRNTFRRCTFLSNSVTAGKFLAHVNSTSQDMRWVEFDSCNWINYSTNWATGITDAIKVTAVNTVFILLTGQHTFVGVGMGISDTVAKVYGAGAAANAGMFVATNPTT